jgi:hypothetical protein
MILAIARADSDYRPSYFEMFRWVMTLAIARADSDYRPSYFAMFRWVITLVIARADSDYSIDLLTLVSVWACGLYPFSSPYYLAFSSVGALDLYLTPVKRTSSLKGLRPTSSI